MLRTGAAASSVDMTIGDVIRIQFSDDDIFDAFEWQKFMDAKNQGKKTKNLNPNKNAIGFLGHLAFEFVLTEAWVPYQSTRTIKYPQGDQYDVIYDGDLIDVKSFPNELSEQWCHNQSCLVNTANTDKYDRTGGNIHFVFIGVSHNFHEGYIYGEIPYYKFMELAVPINFGDPGYMVKSHALKSIHRYIYRV